jgi:hypothetical protein
MLTTCEAIAGVVNVATITRCLLKCIEKLTVTFTCEGKLGLLSNLNILEIKFCTTFVPLHNIPSQITTPVLYPVHFTFPTNKTNKQAQKVNVGM